MMRLTVLTAMLAVSLAGCTSENGVSQPVTSAPEPIEKPVTHRCDAAPAQGHIGHQATQQVGAAILSESGAKTLRWGPPDSMWTMDYREDRVNVRYDRGMKITAISCG